MEDKKVNIHVPKGWTYIPFGQVFDFLPTLSLSREMLTAENSSSDIYNIHYGDIHATYEFDVLDFDVEDRIPKIISNTFSYDNLSFLKEGDLIIADASEDYEGVGECVELKNIKKRKVTGGLHTFVARDKLGLTVPGFRSLLLKHPIIFIELKKLATGSKVFGISKTNLSKLNVLIPSKPEQIKIVKISSVFDKAINGLTLIIAAKEKRKKGLMQNLLTGEARFKEFKKEKWKETTVGEIAYFENGKAHENFISDTGSFIVINSKFISSDGIEYKSTNECLTPLKKDDIVMVMSDVPKGKAIAKCYLIDKNNKYTLNQRICLLRIKKDYPQFIYYIINRNPFYLEFDSGVSQTNLRRDEVLDCPLFIPTSIKEQRKIASVLSACDKEIQSLKTKLQKLQKQKQGLMQELLTGKRRVKIK